MRLLSVFHYALFGGPQNRTLRLAPELSSHGWDVTVLLPDEPGTSAGRFQDAGIDVVTMPLHRLRARRDPRPHLALAAGFWPEVGRIRRLIREREIDLVMLAGLVDPHAAVAARLESRPFVWQLVDTRSPMALRRLLMPVVTRLSDVVMTTGTTVARAHPGLERLGDRLVPFYSPVNTREFRPDAARRLAARAELGVPPEAPLIGTVANIVPQKGLDYLVAAASRLFSRFEELQVRILGSKAGSQDDLARRLEGKVAELGPGASRIRFVDPCGRVAELLPAFDVFLLTSVPRSEGVPTAILEAMACGLPVVATDVGGVHEVVEDGTTGYVTPPLDAEAIAVATAGLLEDGALRSRLGQVARARAIERYDLQACLETHLRAFESALAHHDKARGTSRR